MVYVVALDQHESARMAHAELEAAHGAPHVFRNRHGDLIPSPYLAIMNRAALRMLKAASELGFTPASRPRHRG
jgi:phage terminase small subunit